MSRTAEPASRLFGLERGRPVDRFFIDAFVAEHARDVHGRCLEVASDRYVRAHGASRAAEVDVLDLDPGNLRATVVGDLQDLRGVPDAHYDCIVLTQVLQYLFQPARGVAELSRILAPGGVLLLSAPCVLPLDPFVAAGSDLWRFSPAVLERLFADGFEGDVTVTGWGNATVAAAISLGLSRDDLTRRQLRRFDPAFPCGVLVRAVRHS